MRRQEVMAITLTPLQPQIFLHFTLQRERNLKTMYVVTGRDWTKTLNKYFKAMLKRTY